MPVTKKQRSSKKRKSKSVVRECCICCEDCTVSDFPAVSETVALSEMELGRCRITGQEEQMCFRRGSCTDICVACLLKLTWVPHDNTIVSECPLCKRTIAFNKSMVDRVLTSQSDKYALPVAKAMSKKSFHLGHYTQYKILQHKREKMETVLKSNRMTSLVMAQEYRIKQTNEMLWETKTLHTLQSIRVLMLENKDERDIPRSVLYSHAKLITEIKARPFNDTRSTILLRAYLTRNDPDSPTQYDYNREGDPVTVMDNFEPLYRAPAGGEFGFNDGTQSTAYHGTFANREEALLVLMMNHGMARRSNVANDFDTARRTLNNAAVRTQTPFNTHFGFEMRNNVDWVENADSQVVGEFYDYNIIHPHAQNNGGARHPTTYDREFLDLEDNYLILGHLWEDFHLEGCMEEVDLQMEVLGSTMAQSM